MVETPWTMVRNEGKGTNQAIANSNNIAHDPF